MPELGREGGRGQGQFEGKGGEANLGNAQIYTAFVLKALPYALARPISPSFMPFVVH